MTATCATCGRAFGECGDWAGLCYDCFEREADRMWWEMVAELYGAQRTEARHEPSRPD